MSEIDEDGYNYVVSERGIEFKRQHTKDIAKLLYWIFKDIEFNIASEYELNHRKSNEDSRRQLFAKIIELMELIDPKFAKWEKKEIAKILKENPYCDIL